MRRSIQTSLVAVLLVAVLSMAPARIHAQDINESLSTLVEDNARLYVSPIAEGLGYTLHSGMVEDASAHGQLGFDFGVRVMGSWVPDAKKTFEPVLPPVEFAGTTYEEGSYLRPVGGGDLLTPTAAGADPGIVLEPAGQYRQDLMDAGQDPDDPQYQVLFPDGQDIPAVPFVMLQAGLGIGFNTEVTLRAIPAVEPSADVGEVSAFGLGAKHEIGGWFPTPLPIDVSLLAGYQNVNVGDYLDASSTTVGLAVGRGLGPLDVFGTVESVHPSVDVAYTIDNPDLPDAVNGTEVRFSPDLGSETRFGVGANMQFLILNVSALYTLGDYNVASVKAGVSFR